ncbi:MAG: hypothetical protein R2757_18130 [Draconibacterium sp.]
MAERKTPGLPGLFVGLCRKGYVTATISYRLKKDSIYPAAIEDVMDGIDFLFQHGETYGYDIKSSFDWGFCRGTSVDAGRVCMGKPQKHKVKAVVDIYGPVDMTTPTLKHSLW